MKLKVFITGIDSFTGSHLRMYLKKSGYEVVGSSYKTCDITKKDDLKAVLSNQNIDYIIHLAAISYTAHKNEEEFYRVNTIGTINLLDTILELDLKLSKVILASSAAVYGNQGLEVLNESLCPSPANHYGASKYAMETLAKNYFNKLPIIITRPFNYTGVGQTEYFLIPKMIKHYKEKKKSIELGNLNVCREFNDIGYVCQVYKKLLESDVMGEVVNISSNKPIELMEVIKIMNELAKYEIKVKVNPAFIRKDEIKSLAGCTKKLFNFIGELKQKSLYKLLKEMYEA